MTVSQFPIQIINQLIITIIIPNCLRYYYQYSKLTVCISILYSRSDIKAETLSR